MDGTYVPSRAELTVARLCSPRPFNASANIESASACSPLICDMLALLSRSPPTISAEWYRFSLSRLSTTSKRRVASSRGTRSISRA